MGDGARDEEDDDVRSDIGNPDMLLLANVDDADVCSSMDGDAAP